VTTADISNDAVATALREMARFLELRGVRSKRRAYDKAARAIASLGRPIADLYREGGATALDAIPGMGRGVAERVSGMLSSGSIAELEQMRRETPIDVLHMTAIEGIGPKRARELYRGLGVRSVAELELAAREGKLRSLPQWGERSEQRILRAIALQHHGAAGRHPPMKR
jgi:DNA polymerase (family 10)